MKGSDTSIKTKIEQINNEYFKVYNLTKNSNPLEEKINSEINNQQES